MTKRLKYIGPMTTPFALRAGAVRLRVRPRQYLVLDNAVADEILVTHPGLFEVVSTSAVEIQPDTEVGVADTPPAAPGPQETLPAAGPTETAPRTPRRRKLETEDSENGENSDPHSG